MTQQACRLRIWVFATHTKPACTLVTFYCDCNLCPVTADYMRICVTTQAKPNPGKQHVVSSEVTILVRFKGQSQSGHCLHASVLQVFIACLQCQRQLSPTLFVCTARAHCTPPSCEAKECLAIGAGRLMPSHRLQYMTGAHLRAGTCLTH